MSPECPALSRRLTIKKTALLCACVAGPDAARPRWFGTSDDLDGEAELLVLKGKSVIAPVKERFGPKAAALEYRLAKLA